MFKTIRSLGGIALVIVGVLLATTQIASAHERRTVGAYNFVVGFLNEPALVNQPNSIDLRISKASDSSPVSGLEKTLKAEITFGDQKMSIDLTPRFNTPGAYNAYFMPTKAGPFTFHFTGTIEGQQVDEKFTSSESTFSTPEEPKAFPIEFPSIEGIDQRLTTLEDKQIQAPAKDKSGTALAVGIVGIVVGSVGLAAGGFSLVKKGS